MSSGENAKVVFDVKRQISIKLNTPEGIKQINGRFPTDDEWAERQRRRKIVVKQLGRGVSETIVPNSEDADAVLLAKIRVGDGPDVDSFEATRILEQLGQADVDDAVQEGNTFRVITRIPGGLTTHTLRMPSAKDVIEYRRAFARILDLPFNKQELTVNLAAAETLYQKLCERTEGYAGAVPIIHQAVAVKAAIDTLDASFQEEQPANF